MILNFGQIPLLTLELAVLEHLKTTLSPGFLCVFSRSFLHLQITGTGIVSNVFFINSSSLFQVQSYLPLSGVNYGVSNIMLAFRWAIVAHWASCL